MGANLPNSHQLVGYAPPRDYRYIETNRALRALHPEVVAKVIADIGEAGGSVRRDPESDLLHINEEFTASLAISRCHETAAGSLRWKVRLDSGLRPSFTIVARMEPDNEAIRDYYLLPWLDFGSASNLRLASENGILLDAYRFDTLEPLFDLSRRVPLKAAA
jgi:hypothetical protein